jgi:hypothetical protein
VHTGSLWENLRQRDNSEDLGIDVRIIFKWIFKSEKRAWTGLFWFRIGTGSRLL